MRASFGATTGSVSMVLATAISNSAVKVSFVMIALSSSTLAKMIMISTSETFTALLLMAVASTMLTVPVVSPKLARMKEIVFRVK